MIHGRYYSYLKNYQREDGRAFMEKEGFDDNVFSMAYGNSGLSS
jgi:hypothetical protein